MLGQDRVRRLLRQRRQVVPVDALVGDDLDAGVVGLDRLLEALVALHRHEEVGLVEDQAELPRPPICRAIRCAAATPLP